MGTGGTGIKQLRENIAESKPSYEIMDDAAQAFLKTKIMDNIHKYFYLICFTAYLREAAILCKDAASEDDKKAFSLTGGKVSTPADQLKLNKSFVDYMSEHSKLRTIVDEGKGKLQWERDIPPEALANLESLAASDFKGNLGKIIHDIYQTAHGLFKDLPQGDHKKRAKYRFCLQDPDESSARQPEDRSRRPDLQQDHDFGPVRDFGTVHLGPSQVDPHQRNLSPRIYENFTWLPEQKYKLKVETCIRRNYIQRIQKFGQNNCCKKLWLKYKDYVAVII